MNKETKCPASCKKTSIGGQALMEGIMMRGPEKTAMAVRNTKGEIVIESFDTESKKRGKFFKLPIIRGVFNYIDSMVIGTKSLMRSAEIAGLEEAQEELKREKDAKKAKKAAKKLKSDTEANNEAADAVDENSKYMESDSIVEEKGKKKESSALINSVMVFSVILGMAFSVALFIILPAYLYKGITLLMPFLVHDDPAIQSLIKSVIEGLFKIVILVGYMAAVSLMKDIKRTFMYHGAEHKAIFCYEQGLPLTVENVRIQKRFHPRCGTSFLILMLLVGIFISFFIDPLFYYIFGYTPITIIRVLIKLLLLPIIVGVGYELIKLAGRHDNVFTRIISAPGVWLQHITTKEPDDEMIECAIAALEKVIPDNDSDNW
jgi:uncharacterized protein YqhQ